MDYPWLIHGLSMANAWIQFLYKIETFLTTKSFAILIFMNPNQAKTQKTGPKSNAGARLRLRWILVQFFVCLGARSRTKIAPRRPLGDPKSGQDTKNGTKIQRRRYVGGGIIWETWT
jgi:hypothetical protein